jgi:formylglycine-generating enzyme required for sulfatase activity
VDGFWMDKTEVTNAQFTRFVTATKYVTVAERTPRAEDYPGAPFATSSSTSLGRTSAPSAWMTTRPITSSSPMAGWARRRTLTCRSSTTCNLDAVKRKIEEQIKQHGQ